MVTARFTATLGAGLSVALLAWAAPAQESFGQSGQVVVTADNLAGIALRKSYFEEGGSSDASFVQFGTFATYSLRFAPPLTRLGVHGFVGQDLSLGAGLHWSDADSAGSSTVLAPRVGYNIPMGEATSLWLRGGATWWMWSPSDDDSDVNLSGIGPAADLLFVLSPVEHFALMLGFTGEYTFGSLDTTIESFDPATGAFSSDEASVDFDTLTLAGTFGALGWF